MKYLHILSLLSALFFSIPPSFSEAREPLSAVRAPGQSYMEHMSHSPAYVRPEWGRSVEGVSAVYTAESFEKHLDSLDFENHNYLRFQQVYQWVRDLRFLSVKKRPDFLRRITWQYPDDGCFTRAEMTIRKLKEQDFSGLKKIFVFGDLEMKTSNSSEGVVRWWFHVAPLVKVNFEYYVIDPSVSPSRIMTVRDWIQRMNRDFDNVRLSVCHESSYDPASVCYEEDYVPDEEVLAHQTSYLHKEWYRMVELGRNPEVVLGDHPPWRGLLIERPEGAPNLP